MRIAGDGLVIETLDVDGRAVIALRGEIDLASAPSLTAAIGEGLRRAGTVVLDFAQVTFMDSSGLNVLVATAAGHNGADATVVIRNAPARIVQLLHITGLDSVIRLEEHPVDGAPLARSPESVSDRQ